MTTAVAVLAIVLFILASFWLGQRRLMYYPDPDVPAPASAGIRDAEPVAFKTTDDITLNGWFLPAGSERTVTVVVFNGNAGNRAYRADIGERLRARGLSVLLFDYRGFGENAGVPTERGLTLDARAARGYLLTRPGVSLDRLVYFGESLGSAVATALAAEQAPAALILRSPFTSFVELGHVHFPWLPVRWLLRDRFAPIDQIRSVGCPVLVVAGTRDAIVPYAQSNRVFEAAVSTKKQITIEGADHNDEELVSGERLIDAIVGFLDANRLRDR